MLPNALASYYIKRGWNVWITDFDIKFGFKPGHTQWASLMCVFSFGREKIYENNSFGCLLEQPTRATEHWAGTLLYQQAVSNKKKNVCFGFKGKLSCMFHNAIHHWIKDTSAFYVWKCILIWVIFETPLVGVILGAISGEGEHVGIRIHARNL